VSCGHIIAPLCGCSQESAPTPSSVQAAAPPSPTPAWPVYAPPPAPAATASPAPARPVSAPSPAAPPPAPAPLTLPSGLTDTEFNARLTAARDRLKRSTNSKKKYAGLLLAKVAAGSATAEDIICDPREVLAAGVAVAKYVHGVEDLGAKLRPAVSGAITDEMLATLVQQALQIASTDRDAANGAGDFKINDKTGLPDAGDQGNIDIALGRLGISFSFDQLSQRKMITYGPGRDAPGRVPHTEVIEDRHTEELWLDIDARYKFRPTKELFLTVLSVRANSNAFHPVLAYLDQLPLHDGESRIDTWLIRLAGAKDTPFVRAVSRLILVAAVRRVRQPGCKFDEMLILESITQGTGKTSFVHALCPNAEWFGSRLPLHADIKTRMEATAGKWIIEAGELSGMGQADHRGLKDYLSTQIDEARMAYGRENTRRPRQFVVIGTTNDKQYLRDYLNRRYWPVEITRCDVEGLRAELEQLWAEAAAVEATGESIRLAEELWEVAEAEQEERRVMDPYEMVLMSALDGVTGIIALEDVWRLCGLEKRPTMAESQRINEIMTVKLRWAAARKRRNGRKTVCFVKGEGAADADVWVAVKPSADGWQCVAGVGAGPAPVGPGGTVIPIGAARA